MRRRRDKPRAAGKPAAAEFHHQPFRGLQKLQAQTAPPPPAPVPVKPSPPQTSDDVSLFLREMGDVVQLDAQERARVAGPPPASPARAMVSDDAEALAELSELVMGQGPFDISDSDEHLEAVAAGVDARLVKRLRRGEFAYQAHLDLHGLTAAEAKVAVDRFFSRAHQEGLRCVLLVHGRGLNSKDQIPVLKERVVGWLARGQWSRLILAFSSARACDGGAGALYVLLRRDRKAKRPVHVLNGAKFPS